MKRMLSAITCSLLAATIIWGCKKEKEVEVQLPELTTTAVSAITENAAKTGGTITVYGDKSITVRGICWATHTTPTVNDSCTKVMSADMTYTCTATGLHASTTYYVRAYATSSAGTGYGDELTFTTLTAVQPKVTGYLEEITRTTAKIACDVVTDGGLTTSRGVCWGTSVNPTISDSKVTSGTGIGVYSATITGLTANSSYYVRPFAMNSLGTVYGECIPIRTMYGTVTDVDGNEYQTVLIGTQEWMAEGLRVTHYRNGNAIPRIVDQNQWITSITGNYCYYDNSSANALTYGAIYNWYAAMDSRGIAPAGWHIPSNSEVNTLVTYLGGGNVAGGKLKVSGTKYWESPNTGADNSSGFMARGGGFRYSTIDFSFVYKGEVCGWWMINSSSPSDPYIFFCDYIHSSLTLQSDYKCSGFYIRCVKD